MTMHVSRGERTAYVDAFRRSGLRQTKFCKQLKMNSKTLSRWINMDRNNQSVGATKSSKASSNFDVTEESGLVNSSYIEAQPSFIPVKVMDGAALKTPDDHEISNSPECSALNNSAVIPLKIKVFCMDIPMNFAMTKNVTGVKSLIQILHKLPSDISP